MKLPSVPHLREYLTALCITLGTMSTGVHMGWTSPSIPKLKSDDSPIKITEDEGSWIISFFIVGCLIGPVPGGFLVNRIGRKTTLLLMTIPTITAWVMILLADSVAVLYIARFLGGFAHTATYTAAPIYLGEIASDEIRGALGAGILLSYFVGPFVPFRVLPYVLMSPAIILLATFFILRESPYFYLMKHREEDAMASLKYLRGNDNTFQLQKELNKMKLSVKTDQENKGSFKELFKTQGNRKSLIIMVGCFIGQQLCGSFVVIGYAQEIFAEADGTLGASESAIMLGVVQLLTTLASSSIIDRIGRRPLLLASAAGASITTAVMGGYFYMKYHLESDVSSISWLPITATTTYIILYTVGLASVPFVLMGELFSTNVKAEASLLVGIMVSVFAFSVTKFYEVISNAFGTYVSFWEFSLFSLISFICLFVSLPETKGKSLADIQFVLNKKAEDNAA